MTPASVSMGGSGLIEEPLSLLYIDFAIVVGLLYAYLPFMILTLYASISRLGPELGEATADLGAGRIYTFRRITLPIIFPGVLTGGFQNLTACCGL